MQPRERGFSFVELLVVVGILLIIAAIAIPSYMSAIQRAHEASAVAFLRQVQPAQETYRMANHEYADTFAKLTPYLNASAVPPEIHFGTASDVLFALAPPAGVEATSTDSLVRAMYIYRLSRTQPLEWQCIAEPLRDRTESKFFYTDNSNIIRYAVGALPSASSQQL